MAGFDRCAIAVALEQPFAVVEAGEVPDRLPELLEGVEALDPQHLFLERLDESLDAAVGERRRLRSIPPLSSDSFG